MEIIAQRKKGRQQGSSGRGGVDEEGRFHRVRRRQRAQQDVAGSLRADRQNLRTAELELLFQVTACRPTAYMASNLVDMCSLLSGMDDVRELVSCMKAYCLCTQQCRRAET